MIMCYKRINNVNNIQVMPSFDDYAVTTKTIVIASNICINIAKVFDMLPIVECKLVQNLRQRVKNNIDAQGLSNGNIISIKSFDQFRGTRTKRPTENGNLRTKYFRNSITIVMKIFDRFINMKVSHNGKFQITGCRKSSYASHGAMYFWNYIKGDLSLFSFAHTIDTTFDGFVIPAMRNVNFNIGFPIDRQRFAQTMNSKTEYFAILEISSGYTGINVKFPVSCAVSEIPIKRILIDDDIHYCGDKQYTYEDFLLQLADKEQLKKRQKRRYNTFLVFQSGNVIMSGIKKSIMKTAYNKFIQFVNDHKYDIEERILPRVSVCGGNGDSHVV